jgi:hypothetical protein
MTYPTGGNDIDEDAELTESLHRVLATLIKVRRDRSPLPADRLLERLHLVQWLRGELAAVEALLTEEYHQVRRSAAAGPGDARRPSTAAMPPQPVDGGAPVAG